MQAKDFAYVEGLMREQSHHRCRLGPGARKGLSIVRAASAELGAMDDEAVVGKLRAALRKLPDLSWVEAIDVEQALCEFSKYEAYCTAGVSASKRFSPAGAPGGPCVLKC